ASIPGHSSSQSVRTAFRIPLWTDAGFVPSRPSDTGKPTNRTVEAKTQSTTILSRRKRRTTKQTFVAFVFGAENKVEAFDIALHGALNWNEEKLAVSELRWADRTIRPQR